VALRLLEQKMASHRIGFAVGQALQFSPGMGEYSRRRGRYEVVRQLPEAGNAFQYRIQSETDGHERSGRPDRAPVIRIGYGKPEGEWRAAPKEAMGFERALCRDRNSSSKSPQRDGKHPRS
jgi:hypothetical protein